MSDAPTPTKGTPVRLDRERHFRFPISALRALEGDSSLEQLLFLGLKHEDPELTREQVGEIVSLDMLDQLKEPLKKATGGIIDLDKLFADAGAQSSQPEKKGAQTPTPESETGS